MSSFPLLDLAIGMVFIFFLLSVICSSIVEIVLTLKKVRSKILREWLLTIFDQQLKDLKNEPVFLGQEIMNHCALTALSKQGQSPSYIDSKNFVSALLDKITINSSVPNPLTIQNFISALESTIAISGELKRTFLIYATEAKDTLDTVTVKTTGAIELFRSKMENWYDSNMDRLNGTLKIDYTRKLTCIAAIVVTLLINADTIEILKYLYNNPEARIKLVTKAQKSASKDSINYNFNVLNKDAVTKDTSAKLAIKQLSNALNTKINALDEATTALKDSIPLGWTALEFSNLKNQQDWIRFLLAKLIGMAATVIAIMMGAPFWFDVLNKVSNLRGTGEKPKESKNKTK